MWDKYMCIHNNASKWMKKLRNNSLYEVGTKYGQFIDSTNFKKWAYKQVKNLHIQLACRRWCNAVAYPFGANCHAKMISQWVHIWILTFPWWLQKLLCHIYGFPFPHFLISHFSFLIFIVPTSRVTPWSLHMSGLGTRRLVDVNTCLESAYVRSPLYPSGWPNQMVDNTNVK